MTHISVILLFLDLIWLLLVLLLWKEFKKIKSPVIKANKHNTPQIFHLIKNFLAKLLTWLPNTKVQATTGSYMSPGAQMYMHRPIPKVYE